MTKARKGQSAMEYLMTYGWAILIVIIVVAVLFSLGVFDPSSFTQTTAVGFQGFNVPAGSWQLTNAGVMTMQLTNGVGATVEITQAYLRSGANEVNCTGWAGTSLAPGQTVTLTTCTVPGSYSTGTSYTVNFNMTYTNQNSGLTGFITTGTLTGTVS